MLATALLVLGGTLADQTTVDAAAASPPPTMRMFYVAAPWKRVLDDVAELAGLQLVAPKLPASKYSASGLKEIQADEAIRLVNDELTEAGYRVMVRGEFLIVLHDDSFQPTFPRFKYGTDAEPPAESLPEPAATPSEIQRVSFETPGKAAQPTKTATVIEPQQRTAQSLGRQLYDAYRETAELIDRGPNGLPAFRAATGRPVTVAIDAHENRLVVVADEDATNELIDLVGRLDSRPKNARPLRLVAGDEARREQAEKLRPQIRRMLAMQDVEKAPAPSAPQQPNIEPAAGPATPEERVTQLLDRVRGNVGVESLDNLGLLILEGNESDIDAVEKIIQAIENAGAGTAPEVHLRLLESIDGEAVADLINTTYDAVDQIETVPSRDGKRVVAIPVVRPNAVLIIAPQVELQSVLDLIEKLDTAVDPATELTVIPLRGASATEAVETIREFYEERGGLGARATISADARTNSLLVRARPNDLSEIRSLVASLDAEAAGSLSRVALFPLEFAEAGELADFLNAIIEDIVTPSGPSGAIGQGQQSQRSVALEFFAGPGAGLLRSGVLSEVRISGDTRTNAIAVVAPKKSLPLIEALIDALDRPAGATAEIKVFTLTNADATAAAELLGDLFVDSTAASGDGPPGLRLTGAADAASNLLPVSFSVDVRTNSVLVVGGPDALTVVEAILLRLDSENPRERITQVLKLKNAPAEEVAEAINIFLDSQRELAAVNPDLVSTVEQLDREVIVVPEPVSNTLLIGATLPYFDEMLQIATQLDARPPQVVIQALLVEVELDNLDELGLELGFQDDILFDRSTVEDVVTVSQTITSASGITQTVENVISTTGNPGFLFNNPSIFPQLGNNIGVPGESMVGEQGLTNFGVGRVSSGLDFGGLVLSASSDSVNLLLRALSIQRDVHVLSRPQIRTLDGQLAEIQVGQQVPIINGVTIAATGLATPIIQYDEAGIILSVTPRISPDGQIVMEVLAERSAYINDGGVPVFVDSTSGSVITSPVKNITVARSTVSVRDGQTVVLGGMITENQENVVRKVPFLGDIPIIGRAFRYDRHDNLRTELLMFLTPRVVKTDLDNEIISEVEAARLHFFQEEAEQVHGPLFGVPSDSIRPTLPPDAGPIGPLPGDGPGPTLGPALPPISGSPIGGPLPNPGPGSVTGSVSDSVPGPIDGPTIDRSGAAVQSTLPPPLDLTERSDRPAVPTTPDDALLLPPSLRGEPAYPPAKRN